MSKRISRRGFVKNAGLVIAMAATGGAAQLFNLSQGLAAPKNFKPHAFLEIAPDDTMTIWVGQSELGQGTHTGIGMLLCDEVGGDWSKVQVKMALAADAFKDPIWHFQATGGSTSIRHRWKLFREVGAAAREMLIQAAAQTWGVKPAECMAKNGMVTHKSGRSISFGKLAAKAGSLPLPNNPTPKTAGEYYIVGSEKKRLDLVSKVNGAAVFGADVKLPGMLVATVARPPAYGALPESFDQKAAKAVKGVVAVIPLKDKVAVVATNTWAAIKGKNALDIKWSQGQMPNLNNANLDKWYQEFLEKPAAPAQKIGDPQAALAKAAKKIEAVYKFPYLAHCPLEPMNCTASVEKGRCRIWAPTQGQTFAQLAGMKICKLPPAKVEVMTTYVGGGFGRRGEYDFVVDAVLLSKIVKKPVKVIWTREDDFTHGFYRPASTHRIRGGLDAKGNLTVWTHKLAQSSIMIRMMPQFVKNGVDPNAIDGIYNMDYITPNRFVEYYMVNLPIPVGFWRSVSNSSHPFAVECFMDELAHAAGKGPLEFRLSLLKEGSKPHRLLQILAEKAQWGKPLPKGHYQGVAIRTCFESTVGHVAEVSVESKTGQVKVHRLVGAIDCGTAVFPDGIRQQMEGGAVMGLSAAFKEKVDFDNGGVKTANYNDYPLAMMSDVPQLEMHIVPSGGKAGGVGEPPVTTVGPAVANAIFAATGVRLRELPLDLAKLKKA